MIAASYWFFYWVVALTLGLAVGTAIGGNFALSLAYFAITGVALIAKRDVEGG